jgi:Spy/CpxP family protein refolding chaperone
MKRTLIVTAAILLLGAIAFFFCYHATTRPVHALLQNPDGEMAWLVHEFHLNPEQRDHIAKVQSGYEPRCAEMCRRIEENNAKLNALITAGHARSPEMDALVQASAAIQVDCRREMLDHIYAVAALMSPADGARYLSLMKLQVLQPGTVHSFALHR